MIRYKHYCLLLLLFLFFKNGKAQNFLHFYKKIYQGDVYFEQNNLDSAIIVYEEAFKNEKYILTPYLVKALNTAKKLHDKKRIKHYKKLIKDQKKCPPENKFLLEKIDSIFKIDQSLFNKNLLSSVSYIRNCSATDTCNKLSDNYKFHLEKYMVFLKAIEQNINYLLSLFDKYGYIGERKIGYKNFYPVMVMLMHFETDTNNKVLMPYLLQALYNKELMPIHVAIIIDRHLQVTTGKQKYYTWADCSWESIPLTEQQINKVLQLRESIGIYGSKLTFENIKGKCRVKNYYTIFKQVK